MPKKSNIVINKVYTKKGDSGKTDLIGKKRVLKSNVRVECYGEVDELNSSLGICRALIKENQSLLDNKKDIFSKIIKIQNKLFNLGTMLAVSDNKIIDKFPKIEKSDIIFLEEQIDLFNKDLKPLNSFVLPSGNLAGSYLHFSRAICRRVERKCVSLSELEQIDNHIIVYLNRLSDLLFVWARWINVQSKLKEDLWDF